MPDSKYREMNLLQIFAGKVSQKYFGFFFSNEKFVGNNFLLSLSFIVWP